MKLEKITIENYRSIESITLPVKEIGGSKATALIGVNESGKSSILNAISFTAIEDQTIPAPDYHQETRPVKVLFHYALSSDEVKKMKQKLQNDGIATADLADFEIGEVETKNIWATPGSPKEKSFEINVNKEFLRAYTLKENLISKKNEEAEEDLNVKKYLELVFAATIEENSLSVALWKSEPRYLISEPINIDNFSAGLTAASVPLVSCFELAGITDIPHQLSKVKGNPAEANNLQELLSDEVTKHIKKAWPGHPVNIKFQVDDTNITFLVEDEGVKYKTKTTNQRSDGFKQFVSFLLTVSAQHLNKKLKNTLLLLDEPEVHLHPQGQEDLLKELIKISDSTSKNIVIFATHSNFLIDKKYLNRCFRIYKEKNELTCLAEYKDQGTTYSEVNYTVFNIPTNDYHNELYGFLELNKKDKLNALPKTKKWYNDKKKIEEDVSLATYIRHSIHHPENPKNPPFTKEDLQSSTEKLHEMKYGEK